MRVTPNIMMNMRIWMFAQLCDTSSGEKVDWIEPVDVVGSLSIKKVSVELVASLP